MSSDESGDEHVDLLQYLFSEKAWASSIILADCPFDKAITRAVIYVYVNGELKIKDLLADRKMQAGKQMIRFVESQAEHVIQLPSQRKAVVLPCPAPNCDGQANCE